MSAALGAFNGLVVLWTALFGGCLVGLGMLWAYDRAAGGWLWTARRFWRIADPWSARWTRRQQWQHELDEVVQDGEIYLCADEYRGVDNRLPKERAA